MSSPSKKPPFSPRARPLKSSGFHLILSGCRVEVVSAICSFTLSDIRYNWVRVNIISECHFLLGVSLWFLCNIEFPHYVIHLFILLTSPIPSSHLYPNTSTFGRGNTFSLCTGPFWRQQFQSNKSLPISPLYSDKARLHKYRSIVLSWPLGNQFR